MKRQLIPITIGVTGHRDIPEQDKPRIREVLQSKFQSFKANYPHSPLQLISGLAEGADQIAAEVALEVGFALVAALPMPIEMYEKDFVLPSSLQHFRELLGNAEQINICSPKNYDELRREDLYLSYGHYIVRHAQVVIALWDGTFEQLTTENQREIKVGGTADVVRICRGIMPDKIPNLLVPPESKRVDHLWVRRENENPLHPVIPEEKIATWEVADITEQNSIVRVDRMLRAIDQYNDHAKSIPISAIIQCRNNLVSDQAPVSIITSLSTTVEAFSLADAATGIRQSERAKYVNLISGLTITSILFKEIYSPTTHWVWLSAHIILAILALWAF